MSPSRSDVSTDDETGKKCRRSWLRRDKPHICKYTGCRKSYFYLHDLRRHERQVGHHGSKQVGLQNDTDGEQGEGQDLSPSDPDREEYEVQDLSCRPPNI